MASLTELSGYLNRKSNFACFKVWEVYDAKLLTKAIRSMSGAVWWEIPVNVKISKKYIYKKIFLTTYVIDYHERCPILDCQQPAQSLPSSTEGLQLGEKNPQMPFQSIQFHCWSIFSTKSWLKISNLAVQENALCACSYSAWRAAKHPMEMPSARKSLKVTLVTQLVRSSKRVARTIIMVTGTMRFSRQCSRSQDQKGINKLISFFLHEAVHIQQTYFIQENNKFKTINTLLGKWHHIFPTYSPSPNGLYLFRQNISFKQDTGVP